MWFDIVILIIIVAGAIYGFSRGVLAQVGSVLGVMLGIICCKVFGGGIASLFIGADDNPENVVLVKLLSYICVFLVCYFIGRFVGRSLSTIAKSLHLGIVDKLCGALFNILEYTLVISLFFNALLGAFPNLEIKSRLPGVKKIVLNFAPRVLGSPAVIDFFDSVKGTIKNTSQSVFNEAKE